MCTETIYIDNLCALRSKAFAYACSANCSLSEHCINPGGKEKEKL